ncbi:MAG: RNA polymerase sigma factor [Pseudomonadota bacterium]
MSGNEPSDAILLKRFRDGDRSAFQDFVIRHQDRVFRLARLWLYDAHRADDAAQEAFVRAMGGVAAFRFRAAPFTWLYRTLRNVCHEFNRERRHEDIDAVPPPAQDDDTAQRIDAARAARSVRELVADLPERQREVVVLRVFESMSVAETARVMGCREGTVKALLHKAMAKLRSMVGVS